MSNIMDYITWRGDISFEMDPLNEVDALILSQLSYNHFHGIVDTSFCQKGKSLRTVAADFNLSSDYESRKDVGPGVNPLTVDLLMAASESKRFGCLTLSGHLTKFDKESQEQFSAITFSYKNKWNFAAFRGTDGTIVGWKEDFNMAYMKTIPSQTEARVYLENACKSLKGTLIAGGHSKGGNLAVYASVSSSDNTKKRLTCVYNNDGPGFSEDFFNSEEYNKIKSIQKTYVPEFSIVGMLFDQAENYITVQSDNRGLMQHDPFSWHVLGKHFIERQDINEQSRFIHKTVTEWIKGLSVEQKKIFIETTFSLIKDSTAVRNDELVENWGENLILVLKALKGIDSQTKDVILKTINLLFKYAKENFKYLVKK